MVTSVHPSMRLLESIFDDIRYALRTMRSSAGLTAVAVLSLALGIGATTAIFSVMYALALRPLPIERADQLVEVVRGVAGNLHTYAEWKILRDRQNMFSSVLAYNYFDANFDITADKQSREVSGLYVSGDYFQTLGVPAVIGRALQPSDDRPGAPPVCVIGYGSWRQLYGQSRDVLGQTILVDGNEFRIVGVAPRSFFGVVIGEMSEIFMPLEAERTYRDYPLLYGKHTPSLDDSATLISIVGRLKPGESLSQADAGLQVLSSEIDKALPPKSDNASERTVMRTPLTVSSIRSEALAELWNETSTVLLLMIMAAVALIIACANLGNLLLARATKRQAEIATRLALGASRWRLVRQLLTESVALSLIGAAAGLLIERWASQTLLWALSWPDEKISLDLSWDTKLVFFVVGITLFCALLFGLAPAIRATRIPLYSAMNNGVATGKRTNRISNSLVIVVQVALSMALLVSAGLLARTLHAFLTADLGYDPKGVLVAHATLQETGENSQREAFVGQELLVQFRSVPGVVSASWSRTFSQMYPVRLAVHGSNGLERRLAPIPIFVSPDFFKTRRTPILTGREFNDGDRSASLPVAILSKTLSETFFGKVNPVGLRFRENDSNGKGQDYTVEVVGVAADIQYRRPDYGPLLILYRPVSQCADSCSGLGSYEIRVAGAFPQIEKRLESAAGTVDSGVAVKYGSLMEGMNNVLHRNRAMELIAMAFSLFVGLLAMIGVYGVTSYTTAERTREIGIRMALGAQPRDVFQMILRETVIVVFAGVALGVAAGFAAAQMIRSMLWGVSPSDPVSFAFATCVMMLVAVIAALLPAYRAAKSDPMIALRFE
ncbi:MAG TPA: ABC transporter permease [Candidatus Acidoferrales bacterium]|nr:ABC transporter permease [Candidatus Acidoferrales bacterium]